MICLEHSLQILNNFVYIRLPNTVLLLLYAPKVKGKWVNSNFQIIDLLVPPRAAGVTGTHILFTLQLCYPTTLAACRIFYLPYFFNSLHTHRRPVLSSEPP